MRKIAFEGRKYIIDRRLKLNDGNNALVLFEIPSNEMRIIGVNKLQDNTFKYYNLPYYTTLALEQRVNEILKKEKKKCKIINLITCGAAISGILFINRYSADALIQVFTPYNGQAITLNEKVSSVNDSILMLNEKPNIVSCPEYLKEDIVPFLKEIDKYFPYIPNVEKNIANLKVKIFSPFEYHNLRSDEGVACCYSSINVIDMQYYSAYARDDNSELTAKIVKVIFQHELMHNISNGGFQYKNTDLGYGINEGMTALLAYEIFGGEEVYCTYPSERQIIRALLELNNPGTMANQYFSNDLNGLISNMTNIYGTQDDAKKLISTIDKFTLLGIRNKDKDGIKREPLKMDILIQLMKYEKSKLEKDIEQDVYPYINHSELSFVSELCYMLTLNEYTFNLSELDRILFNKLKNDMKEDLYKKYADRYNIDVNLLKKVEKYKYKYDKHYYKDHAFEIEVDEKNCLK